MDRYLAFGVAVWGGMVLAQGTEPTKGRVARASLVDAAGRTFATASLDPSGVCVFRAVPEGVYKVLLTREDGRTVTIGDLDGDGHPELVVAAHDFNTTRSNNLASTSPSGGDAGSRVQDHNSSRSNKTASIASSGVPWGQRMHKPFSCVVSWDGRVKGPYPEAAARVASPGAASAGSVGVKVHCPSPSTVQIESWSVGHSALGR